MTLICKDFVNGLGNVVINFTWVANFLEQLNKSRNFFFEIAIEIVKINLVKHFLTQIAILGIREIKYLSCLCMSKTLFLVIEV